MFERGFKAKCERLAKTYRDELGIKAIDPLDPFRLAEILKITTCTVDDLDDLDEATRKVLLVDDREAWSAATISWKGDYLIVLNQTHSSGRTNSNLAHELSHLIIGHSPARVDVTDDDLLILDTYDKRQEEEADWLCGCLLLPREALLHIKRKKIPSANAIELYGVSERMFTYRMNITGVSKQAVWN